MVRRKHRKKGRYPRCFLQNNHHKNRFQGIHPELPDPQHPNQTQAIKFLPDHHQKNPKTNRPKIPDKVKNRKAIMIG